MQREPPKVEGERCCWICGWGQLSTLGVPVPDRTALAVIGYQMSAHDNPIAHRRCATLKYAAYLRARKAKARRAKDVNR